MQTPDHLDTKAVPNVPFYLSQANQEFLGAPVGSASATMGAAGVTVPGYVSALGGLSSAPPVAIVTPPPSSVLASGYGPASLYFYTQLGNTYWRDTYTYQVLTTGIGKLVLRKVYQTADAAVNWAGCIDGVQFVPDAVQRGVDVWCPEYSMDEWADFYTDVYDAAGNLLGSYPTMLEAYE